MPVVQIKLFISQFEFLFVGFFWAGLVGTLLRARLMLDLTQKSDSGGAA